MKMKLMYEITGLACVVMGTAALWWFADDLGLAATAFAMAAYFQAVSNSKRP